MCAYVLLYLRAWRVLSHIAVCGKGTRSEKGIVHYHKNNILQAKVSCLCTLPWGKEETLCQTKLDVASYQCIIGNMKTQQEAALKPGVCVDMTCRADIFGFIYKILFHFI